MILQRGCGVIRESQTIRFVPWFSALVHHLGEIVCLICAMPQYSVMINVRLRILIDTLKSDLKLNVSVLVLALGLPYECHVGNDVWAFTWCYHYISLVRRWRDVNGCRSLFVVNQKKSEPNSLTAVINKVFRKAAYYHQG